MGAKKERIAIPTKNQSKKYHKELIRLYGIWGELTASAVVGEAAAPDSVLHDYFVWEDSKAAHEYRLIQARGLIRSVRVFLRLNGKTSKLGHVFVHVPSEDGGEGSYHTREVIAKNVDMFGRALVQLERSLLSAHEAVEEMRLLAPRRKRRAISTLGQTIGRAQEQARQLEPAPV